MFPCPVFIKRTSIFKVDMNIDTYPREDPRIANARISTSSTSRRKHHNRILHLRFPSRVPCSFLIRFSTLTALFSSTVSYRPHCSINQSTTSSSKCTSKDKSPKPYFSPYSIASGSFFNTGDSDV